MKKSFYFFVYLFLFISAINISFSQKEFNNWYCDDYSAITFNTNDGKPIALYDSKIQYGPSATISDANGNLLFYTNGVSVYNKNHEIMFWGDGLAGDSILVGEQCSIAPLPGSNGIYYIFTTGPRIIWGTTRTNNFLRYSIVDMNLEGGLGGVIKKNIKLMDNPSGQVNGTLHKNGKDIWIISRQMDNSNFYAFLLTSSGIQLPGIISKFDNVLPTDDYYWSLGYGPLVISKDGKKIASSFTGCWCPRYGVWSPHNRIPTYFETFDFDKATGKVSNQKYFRDFYLNTCFGNIDTTESLWIESVKLSPDGTKLYMIFSDYYLYQLDLTLDSASMINDCKILAERYVSLEKDRTMQIGPDNKIYIPSSWWEGNVIFASCYDVINFPNEKGIKCDLQRRIINTFQHLATYLPNDIFYFPFVRVKPEADSVCEGETIHLKGNVRTSVPGESVSWIGPNGFASKVSNFVIPNATLQMSGSYKITVTLNGDTATDSVYVKVYSNPNLYFQPSGPVHICQGDSAYLKALSDSLIVTYQWSNGKNKQGITVKQGGIYSITITDINSCVKRDSIQVIVDYLPKVRIVSLGATTFCDGDSVILKAEAVDCSSLWSTGDTTTSIVVKNSGKYYLWGTNQNGCKSSDSIEINVSKNLEPKIMIAGNPVNCEGDSVILSSSIKGSGYNYKWSTGDTTESIIVKTSDKYKLKVSIAGGCQGNDSTEIVFMPKPVVKIVGPNNMCKNDTIILSSDSDFPVYKWSTGDTTKSIFVNKPGTYSIQVMNESGCSGYDTITIKEINFNIDLSSLAYNFGKVLINTDSNFTYTYINTTSYDITFSKAEVVTNDGIYSVQTNPTLPALIKSGEQIEFKLTFSPKELKSYINQINISIDEPCHVTLTFNESGTGFMRMLVWFSDTTGQVGDTNYCIKLHAMPETIINEPLIIPYKSEVSWYAQNYLAQKTAPAIIESNNSLSGNQTIGLNGRFTLYPQKQSLITDIYGTVLLSEKKTTPLIINSFQPENSFIEVETKDGSLTTTGVCVYNLRAITGSGPTSLTIQPNPAEDKLNLNLKGNKNYPYSLKIYNTNGEILYSKSGELDSDELTIELDLTGYSSGIYLVNSLLSGEPLTERLIIIK